MKKLLTLILFFCIHLSVNAKTLQGGISLDKVPKVLYGSWIVSSIQIYTNNSKYNAPPSIDYWNIYRSSDVLTLENPQSNARASITIDEIKNNTITFTRISKKEDKETIETPTITIRGENFYGKDKMLIKKYKNNTLIDTDVIEFSIRGRKIGGNPVSKLLN